MKRSRRQDLLALLGTLYDLLPSPETWTGKLQRRALVERKPAPVAKAGCPTCQGRGRIGQRGCDVCQARGYLVVDPMTYLDPRTGRPRPREAIGDEQVGPLRTMSPMELDAALRRLEEQDTTMDAEAAMIAGIENRRRAGSYAELDRCLASLARQSPRGFFLVWQVHIGRQVSAEHLTPIAAAQLERSVGYLLALMPNKIRVPKHLGGTGDGRPRSRSAEAIRLHFDEGLTVPEIVRRTGLSRSRIYEVLAEAAARRVRATNGEAA